VLLVLNTRTIESRVEALERTLANGLQLPEGFEEGLDARMTLIIYVNWKARPAQQDSRMAHLEKIVERFVKRGSGKSVSVVTTMNQRFSTKIAQEESVGEEFVRIKSCDKWRQLDTPAFEGEYAMGWIGKVERYF